LVNDNGFYQVSFGFSMSAATDATLGISVDGTAPTTTTQLFVTDTNNFRSATIIVSLTGGTPHSIRLVNTSGAARTVSATGGGLSGLVAYITVVKLQ
jgi:hypothetical protein